MEELKPYTVEIEENGAMKPKIYPSDCAVGGNDRRPIIVITHDEYTFSSNNGIRRAWTEKVIHFCVLKVKDKASWLLNFFLPNVPA